MMTHITEKKFPNREALFNQLLLDTSRRVQKAVSDKNTASLLLSGGTTPGNFYKLLSHQDLPWDKVYLSTTDERWLPASHPDTCEYLVRKTFMQNGASQAQLIGLKSPPDDILEGYPLTLARLQKMPRPFDMVFLGMGLDGHIASLIPTAADTHLALDPANVNICQYIRNPDGDCPRISMTLNSLLDCPKVTLLFFGAEKWQVYIKACATPDHSLPISHILHQVRTPVEVYWCP